MPNDKFIEQEHEALKAKAIELCLKDCKSADYYDKNCCDKNPECRLWENFLSDAAEDLEEGRSGP